MQEVSADWLAALQGSYQPTVRVDAWYDGELVHENIPVADGQVTLDRSRAIAGSLSLSAASPDGSLIPSSWESPLAPYGSVLNVRAGIAYGAESGETVSLGWYVIDAADPKEWWVPYRPSADLTVEPEWVCRGTLVQVTAADRMTLLDEAKFVTPEAPESLTSILGEISRLARDYVPVDDFDGKVDTAVPRSITYQTSRVEALQALADVIGYWVRMSPGGGLTLVPQAPSGTPVWSVTVGEFGTVAEWSRRQERAGLRNGFVSRGQKADGTPVQGFAVENTGPLRWGGPLGSIPEEYTSNLLTTDTAAEADAQARLTRMIRERVSPVSVKCVTNPALELDDTVSIVLPDRTLIGQVSQLTIPLGAATMSMVVTVPRDQLWGL